MQTDVYTNPVGDGGYVVRQGDCLESIAFTSGLLWQTIWNNPNNVDLRRTRGDRNILLPGDQLFVPAPQPKSVDASTGRRHPFLRKGAWSRIRMQILGWVRNESPDADEPYRSQPRPQLPYLLVIDGQSFSGQTDANGWINHPIPPNAKAGKLILEPGTENAYARPLVLGGLDPIDAESGICQRLANLGYISVTDCQSNTAQMQDAIRAFQSANGLQPTGVADDATRTKLQSVHNS